MIFLSYEEQQIINNLNKIRSTTVVNGMGNKTSKRVFLTGINTAKLEKVRLSQGRTGRYYIEVTFSRKPAIINGTKEYFADLVDYLFYPDEKLNQLCLAYGHELKLIPEGYALVSYLKHVAARVNTFIGKELKVSVKSYNDLVRGDYGEVKQAAYINGNMMDKHTTRVDVIRYYPLSDEVIVDWNEFL